MTAPIKFSLEQYPPAIRAIPAIPEDEKQQNSHRIAKIARIASGNSQNEVFEITETERAYLTGWLSRVGETNPESIAEFWHNIRHKEGAKAYFLQRAMNEATPDYRRHCRECQNHRPIAGRGTQVIRCTVKNSVKLDNLPRHCEDYLFNKLSPDTTIID